MNAPAPQTAPPLPAPAAAKLLQGQMCLVYETMARGLAVTSLAAALINYAPAVEHVLVGTWMHYIFLFSPMAFVFFKLTRRRLATLPLRRMQGIFYGFCFVLGVSCASFLYRFDSIDIFRGFFSATCMFLAMNIYGRTTKRVMHSVDAFLLMGLFGLIVAAVVNLLFLRDGENFIASGVTLAFLLSLTAWEAQIIREDFEEGYGEDITRPATQRRFAYVGAMGLYMNLINLLGFFLFFGGASNER